MARAHVTRGVLKAVGANGLQLGAVSSQANLSLHTALGHLAIYSSSSPFADHISANDLGDSYGLDSYLAKNSRLLAEIYIYTISRVKIHGVRYERGVGTAFFLRTNPEKACEKTPLRNVALESGKCSNLGVTQS